MVSMLGGAGGTVDNWFAMTIVTLVTIIVARNGADLAIEVLAR
jgi:hypothetical protein